jgi:hypothetical protein
MQETHALCYWYIWVRIRCDNARRTTASGKKLGLRSGPGQFFTGLITEHTSKWKNHSVSGAPTCCIWHGGGGGEKIGKKERGGKGIGKRDGEGERKGRERVMERGR